MFFIREVKSSDLNEHVRLYRQLASVSKEKITQSAYDEFINKSKIFVACSDDYFTLVGTITVIIEQKLIHDFGRVAHIEDVVVDSPHRNYGIGKTLVEHAVDYAKKEGCYKVILDCSDENTGFYTKSGFLKHGNEMSKYFEN